MIKREPHTDTYVEVEYTRDRQRDLPCGGWVSTPEPPAGDGWFIWDTIPDRKSGWLRVWKRGGGLVVHADGGVA